MVQITIDIPKELEFMKKIPSVVITAALIKMLHDKAREIKEIDDIVAKSQLTEADVDELSDKINKSIAKHYSKYK